MQVSRTGLVWTNWEHSGSTITEDSENEIQPCGDLVFQLVTSWADVYYLQIFSIGYFPLINITNAWNKFNFMFLQKTKILKPLMKIWPNKITKLTKVSQLINSEVKFTYLSIQR